ncbi:MAG: NAD-dependent epimerase/dehydratase family protein [Hyphomicrobiaceae bacterium]
MQGLIFVTGGGGFVGQSLIRKLSSCDEWSVAVLVRRRRSEPGSQGHRFRQITGDLLEPASYREALTGCDTVVHLAAATGRAAPGDYERVNVEGTRVLLQACRAAGVRRFLYVSTIAAGYPDQRYYAYAKTKAEAERLVRQSGLEFVILRPTLVLGEKSPIWNTLVKIAKLPVVPLFEGRRPVSVQPIHVDDVVRGIMLLLESEHFTGEVLELGGPQPIPFRTFLKLTQQALRDKPGKLLRIPLAPVRTLLAALEPVARPVMPVTAGQLAVFANDSVAADNWLQATLWKAMPSIEELITRLVDDGRSRDGNASIGGPQIRPEMRPMTDQVKRALRDECRALTAYLLGTTPSAYIEEQYAKAVHVHALAFDEDFSCFDRTTVDLARRGRLLARSADAYCGLLHRRGVLRRKLIVLAAILEHAAPTNAAFDRVTPRPVALTILSICTYGVVATVSLALGATILVPAKLICAMMARSGLRVRSAQ